MNKRGQEGWQWVVGSLILFLIALIIYMTVFAKEGTLFAELADMLRLGGFR